jgi:hypothetical protein
MKRMTWAMALPQSWTMTWGDLFRQYNAFANAKGPLRNIEYCLHLFLGVMTLARCSEGARSFWLGPLKGEP